MLVKMGTPDFETMNKMWPQVICGWNSRTENISAMLPFLLLVCLKKKVSKDAWFSDTYNKSNVTKIKTCRVPNFNTYRH